MADNKNLVALVTGANRGLGLETSRQLARAGVTVIMGGRTAESIEAAAKTLRGEGLEVLPVVLDVVNTAHHETVRAKIEADFGRLDILINNAGIITGEHFGMNSSTSISHAALRETFEVNLFAPILLTQTLLPLIEKAPAGRIVNLSSVLGSLTVNRGWDDPETAGYADFKPTAYDASKAALNMFTVHLAAHLRNTNVKVNSAHPGWVKTDMGSEAAPMEIVDGAKTSVALALLDADGPTGAFVHMGQELPW